MKYFIILSVLMSISVPYTTSAQITSVEGLTRPQYGGVITSIIIPTVYCPFFSYVVTGPASTIITPLKLTFPLKIGHIVAGIRKKIKYPLCPGWQVYDISVAGKMYAKVE